jgi:hypothetical protein
MKLIEAMKELKLVEKRMEKNIEQITQYSSGLSNEKEIFGSEQKQIDEVKSLLQANVDLFNRYLYLKRSIERTNLETKVEFSVGTYSISELLVIKRRLQHGVINTFKALNTQSAEARMRTIKIPDNVEVKVVRYYREEEKNLLLKSWMEFFENIDGRLEVVNATTDLIEN